MCFAMIGFGILGYGLRKAGYDVAPFLLAFVIGSMFEQNLRQGLIVGYGDPLVFLRSPISAGFLLAAANRGVSAWHVAPPRVHSITSDRQPTACRHATP